MKKSYVGIVYAKSGKLLLGGVKSVTSHPFETKVMAKDWAFTVGQQPNAYDYDIKEVTYKRPITRKETHRKNPVDPQTARYREAQFEGMIAGHDQYKTKIKFTNSGGETKWMNIEKNELVKIIKILTSKTKK